MSDVTPEVLEQLRRVRPADASDALDSLGYVDTFAMDVAMRPLACERSAQFPTGEGDAVMQFPTPVIR
jgi:hypothetical protein